MCQCAQRRDVIVSAAQGAFPVHQAMGFVATSLVQDAKTIASAALAAARTRLIASR